MPFVVDEEFDPTTFVNIDDGMYRARIFNIERKQKERQGGIIDRFYEITVRIDGGTFDGEDVIERYVGLSGKSLFRMYEILTALGEIGAYYTPGDKSREIKGKWHHLPEESDLVGKQVIIKVEDEPFQSVKEGQPQFNEDGSPKMLRSPRITSYHNAKEPMPEFKPTQRKAPANPTQQGGFAQPQQQGGWNAPAQGGPAPQQAGGFQAPAQPQGGPGPIW